MRESPPTTPAPRTARLALRGNQPPPLPAAARRGGAQEKPRSQTLTISGLETAQSASKAKYQRALQADYDKIVAFPPITNISPGRNDVVAAGIIIDRYVGENMKALAEIQRVYGDKMSAEAIAYAFQRRNLIRTPEPKAKIPIPKWQGAAGEIKITDQDRPIEFEFANLMKHMGDAVKSLDVHVMTEYIHSRVPFISEERIAQVVSHHVSEMTKPAPQPEPARITEQNRAMHQQGIAQLLTHEQKPGSQGLSIQEIAKRTGLPITVVRAEMQTMLAQNVEKKRKLEEQKSAQDKQSKGILNAAKGLWNRLRGRPTVDQSSFLQYDIDNTNAIIAELQKRLPK